MNETIKLIIEIPKEMHEALLKGYEEPYSREFSDVVKNGTPLDTVKAEIRELRDSWEKDCYHDEAEALNIALKIIDKHIGKAESNDPNDLTHMFDGVTEIPEDAFKGWYTDSAPLKVCKNTAESYGEICVKCNKCGRFDKHIGNAESEE